MRNTISLLLFTTGIIFCSFLLFQLNSISATLKSAHGIGSAVCQDKGDTKRNSCQNCPGYEQLVSKDATDKNAQKISQQLWHSLQETVSEMAEYDWEPGTKPLSGKKICFVTAGFYGPIKVGGVAIITYRQAKLYQENGAEISVLYTGYLNDDDARFWVKSFMEEGIRFIPVPYGSGSYRIGTAKMKRSHDVYEFLSRKEDSGAMYDIIVFHDLYGIGYYTLEAKRLGLRFLNSAMMLHAHGSTKLSNFYNAKVEHDKLDGLVTYAMERQSVQNADFVLSPSEFYYRWMSENGYALGNNKYFTIYLLMPSDPFFDHPTSYGKKVHSTRFAFFGRMDRLKGTLTFLDALDLLVESGSRLPDEVLFVGDAVTLNVQEGPQNSYDQIRFRAKQWPFNVTIIEHASSKTALEAIKNGSFVMVNPTHGETASAVTIEALAAGVPIIASNVCAIPELFYDKERFRTTSFAAGSVEELSEALVTAMNDGVTVNRRPLDSKQSRSLYVQVAMAALDRSADPIRVTGLNVDVKVTVAIIATRTDELLLRTLRSVYNMIRYSNDVDSEILVSAETIAVQRKLEQFLSAWRSDIDNRRIPLTCVLSTGDVSPASARRLLLENAKGEYILMVKDDTIPTVTSLSTLLSAAVYVGADIASGFTEVIERPVGSTGGVQKRLQLCMGGDQESLLFRDINSMCSSIMLLRKDAAITAGSFDDNGYVSSDYIDWNMHFSFELHQKRSIVIPNVTGSTEKASSKRARNGGPEEVFFGHYSRVHTLCKSLGVPPTLCTSLVFSTESLSETMDL